MDDGLFNYSVETTLGSGSDAWKFLEGTRP